MYFYKFPIPTNADGSRVTYSPGWAGTMDKCPSGVVVDLYNDKEGYGIAHTPDSFIPKEVKVLDEKEANILLSQSINQLTADTNWRPIFFADGLIPEDREYSMNLIRNRWSGEVKKLEEIPKGDTQPASTKAIFCPTCHRFITWLPINIIAATINLTCPIGHRVVLNGE